MLSSVTCPTYFRRYLPRKSLIIVKPQNLSDETTIKFLFNLLAFNSQKNFLIKDATLLLLACFSSTTVLIACFCSSHFVSLKKLLQLSRSADQVFCFYRFFFPRWLIECLFFIDFNLCLLKLNFMHFLNDCSTSSAMSLNIECRSIQIFEICRIKKREEKKKQPM